MTSNTSTLLCTVDEMLLDAGETDPRLRATLLQLGALASLPVPEPRAELAALLSAPTSQLARQRLRRRHRTAAVGLAVIAGMGLGVTGVAATASAPSANARGSVQHLLQDWAPSWTIAGVPAASGGLPRTPAAEPGSPDGSVPAGRKPRTRELPGRKPSRLAAPRRISGQAAARIRVRERHHQASRRPTAGHPGTAPAVPAAGVPHRTGPGGNARSRTRRPAATRPASSKKQASS